MLPEETMPENVLAGKRIVIVEDEGITQLQLRKILIYAGLNVVGSAVNGKEGMEVILREQPDLVLMDINMSQMDGLEATKIVMKTHKTCIVILTAYADETHRRQAQEAGAHGYLLKPITRDILLPMLQETYKTRCL
jgi:YesN/AraC family two-component response regulator